MSSHRILFDFLEHRNRDQPEKKSKTDATLAQNVFGAGNIEMSPSPHLDHLPGCNRRCRRAEGSQMVLICEVAEKEYRADDGEKHRDWSSGVHGWMVVRLTLLMNRANDGAAPASQEACLRKATVRVRC